MRRKSRMEVLMDLSTANIEHWKPFGNGRYEISSCGRVRRMYIGPHTFIGRIKQLQHNSAGYVHVTISVDGAPKTLLVHQLVAEHFIGRRPEGMVINHKDANKNNNGVENLEYVTPYENVHHTIRLGRNVKGEAVPQSKLKLEEVKAIKHMLLDGIPCKIIGDMFKVTPQAIRLIKHRINWAWV